MKCFVDAKPLYDRRKGVAKKHLSSDQWTRLHVRIVHPNDHVTSQIEHGDDVMSTMDIL
jgi:hypothetical protein